MIENQKKEIEKAVAGMGEYQISEQYKHFEVPARKFFQMTTKQKEKHIKSFLTAPLVDESDDNEFTQNENECALNVSSQNPFTKLEIPTYVVDKIWKDSEAI